MLLKNLSWLLIEINEGRLEGERLDKYLADATINAVGTLVRPFVDQTILTKAITDVGYAMLDAGRKDSR